MFWRKDRLEETFGEAGDLWSSAAQLKIKRLKFNNESIFYPCEHRAVTGRPSSALFDLFACVVWANTLFKIPQERYGTHNGEFFFSKTFSRSPISKRKKNRWMIFEKA